MGWGGIWWDSNRLPGQASRSWHSQSSPGGEDVSMALASQSEYERKVHTDANVPGAWKALQVACLSVENDADAAAHKPPATA